MQVQGTLANSPIRGLALALPLGAAMWATILVGVHALF